MKRFGLIGYPLSHSFSEKYFTEKFEQEGLSDHLYELFPLQSIDQLPQLIAQHPDLCGLNVTIPYKREVMPFLHATKLPGNINATNCIRIEEGRLTGFDTDVIGFEESFKSELKPIHKKALVLGNGGATAAVVYVLKKLGIPFRIVSRNGDGEMLKYEAVDQNVIEEHQIIINTTPLGTYPDIQQSAPIPYQYITSEHYLFDLIYNPAKTVFLQKGEERGATIKNGYGMLVIQAEESWKIWSGTATTFFL